MSVNYIAKSDSFELLNQKRLESCGAVRASAPNIYEPVVALLDYAHERGRLKAEQRGFKPVILPTEIRALGESEMRAALLSAFTSRLTPPAAAASLCILIGLHPVWALFVSHQAHFRGKKRLKTSQITRL